MQAESRALRRGRLLSIAGAALLSFSGLGCAAAQDAGNHSATEQGERFLPSDNGSAGSILALVLDQPYRPGTKMLSQSEQREKTGVATGVEVAYVPNPRNDSTSVTTRSAGFGVVCPFATTTSLPKARTE